MPSGVCGYATEGFSLGAAFLHLGRYAEAIERFESVRAIHGAHHGFESIPVGDDYLALAEAYRQSGDITSALSSAQKNIEIRRIHLGEEGQRLTLAQAHAGLGVIAQAGGQWDLARQAILDSIDVLINPPRVDLSRGEHEQLRLSYINLALVEWDRGDRAAARVVIEKARAIQDAVGERDGIQLVDTAPQRVAEARVLLELGKPHDALTRLEGAESLPDAIPEVEGLIAEARALAAKMQ